MRTSHTAAFLAVAFGVAACQETPAPFAPSEPTAQLAISDGAHGGSAHFYFLPPLVPPPRPTGAFDPTLSPVVSVCRLPDCTTDIATFRTGHGPSAVTLDREESAYRVIWHTKDTELSVGTRLRVRVSVGQALLGFIDLDVVSKSGRSRPGTPDVVSLREDHPLLIKFRIERGAVVGPPAQPLKLAFASDRDNSSFVEKLYLMNADGSHVVQLTEIGSDAQPAWSPDGNKIAFTRNVGIYYYVGNIFVVNADGTGETRLTTQPGRDPVWSPDGEKIAFVRSDPFGYGDIAVMAADGSGLINVTSGIANDGRPVWSPDGSKIAFSRAHYAPQYNIDIFVVNADGSGLIRLTDDYQYEYSPAWSPDGTRIAFDRRYAEGSAPYTGNIWLVNPDGSGEVNITNFTDQDAAAPMWSPSGDKIAFSGGDPDVADIWVMNSDGSGLVNLTKTTTEHESGAVWAPDGSVIAFSSLRDNHGEIFTIKPDGTDRRNLTNNPADDWDYAWKPLVR